MRFQPRYIYSDTPNEGIKQTIEILHFENSLTIKKIFSDFSTIVMSIQRL